MRDAVALANRAPSVHNTQPWHWYTNDHSLHLYPDFHRWLQVTDHDGRDMIISCGAALHHLRVALAACDLATRVQRLPNPDEPDHLAAIEYRRGRAADADLRLATAITQRRTDRRPYGRWPVPEAYFDELAAHGSAHGATLRVLDNTAQADVLACIQRAEATQRATSGYDTELAVWTRGRASNDGIPAANLPREHPSPEQPARWFGSGELAPPTGPADGSRLLVIGTTSDDALSFLRAGEALSAVLLHATQLGLATCPLSQPLEVASTRVFLRQHILDDALAPQVLVRIGWPAGGSLPPRTPRRPTSTTIDPMTDTR